MEKVGDKATARQLMSAAGLPLLPGTVEPVNTLDEAHDIAGDIGYPMIIKAVAGGGGRGMSVVQKPEELATLYQTTRATAQAVFKDSAVYIERYLETSRHTEIQLVCDSHGNGVYFGERDCSVQRRHQKLIEEAPSIHLTEETRREVGEAAVRGALSVGYTGAGTMEFLLDLDGNLYFMEMNARIQVEHPVSELVTNTDLIQEQIRVAAGEPLSVDAGGRAAADGARDRVPHQRRGSRQQLRSRGRQARHLRSAGRTVDARRLALLPGLGDQPVLRLADREADRLGAGPRQGDRPDAARAVGVRDLRARGEDDDPVPPADARPPAVPLRRRHHRLRRAGHGTGSRGSRGRELRREHDGQTETTRSRR